MQLHHEGVRRPVGEGGPAAEALDLRQERTALARLESIRPATGQPADLSRRRLALFRNWKTELSLTKMEGNGFGRTNLGNNLGLGLRNQMFTWMGGAGAEFNVSRGVLGSLVRLVIKHYVCSSC